MQYITLNNGTTMPLVGFGTYALTGNKCRSMVLEAIRDGYQLFDTAQMYGNEREVGQGVSDALSNLLATRENLFITAKLYRPSASHDLVKSGINRSLDALGLDYIDLLLIHEPYDEAEEMWAAMEEAYDAKLVRAIGVSNFNASRYARFIKICRIIPAVNQVEAHVFFQRPGLHELLVANGTHMQAWSPLAAGRNNIFHNGELRKIGEKYGVSASQVALRFLVLQGISVIPKSAHIGRMRHNLDIFSFELASADMEKLKKLNMGKSLFGWYPA